MGNIRFGVPRELVLWLSKNFGIETFVETGTNRAATTVWAADHFEHVFTVEGYEPLYLKAVESYGHRKNIKFLKGDSRDHIKNIVDLLSAPAIFWLDAHWCGEQTFGKSGECPVVNELEVINHSPLEHIVLVDDARLFLAPPPAPHEANHWPDIAELCRLLTSHRSKRYVAVHDDVIIAIPETGKSKLVEFIRTEVLKEQAGTRGKLGRIKRSILKRIG